ncbi:transposable element Tcb2 transposase [Trichonephila clavipes]|nr:transposable element Tcb2 transposase [Trichonephila clavipes]
MPLRRFRRQYEQLSQLERGRMIRMMEAGWSARRVSRQLGRSGWVAIASSSSIQAQVAPSLGTNMSFRTLRRRLAEGCLGSRRQLHVLLMTPDHLHLCLELCRARGNCTAVEWSQASLVTNPD